MYYLNRLAPLIFIFMLLQISDIIKWIVNKSSYIRDQAGQPNQGEVQTGGTWPPQAAYCLLQVITV